MQQTVIKQISLDTVSAIIEQSTEQQTVDTGSSFISNLLHPVFGIVTLVTNTMDDMGVAIVDVAYAEKLAA